MLTPCAKFVDLIFAVQPRPRTKRKFPVYHIYIIVKRFAMLTAYIATELPRIDLYGELGDYKRIQNS